MSENTLPGVVGDGALRGTSLIRVCGDNRPVSEGTLAGAVGDCASRGTSLTGVSGEIMLTGSSASKLSSLPVGLRHSHPLLHWDLPKAPYEFANRVGLDVAFAAVTPTPLPGRLLDLDFAASVKSLSMAS